MSMYVEFNLYPFGVFVPKVGVIIMQNPSEHLDVYHYTKLSGVINWNLIKLAYQVFVENLGKRAWKILTVQQVLVHCYFHSFVYSITARWVKSSQTV